MVITIIIIKEKIEEGVNNTESNIEKEMKNIGKSCTTSFIHAHIKNKNVTHN